MKRVILTQNEKDILGSDGLLLIDGRLNLESIKEIIFARNYTMKKNFPHKVADGFYLAGEQLKQISKIYELKYN